MKYKIYYSASGLPKHEQPLSFKLIEHHLSCLTGDIGRYFADQNISLQQSVVESGPQNVVINFEASDPSLDVHAMLTTCIEDINMRTTGLCFFMEHIDDNNQH